jgi:hypothetical protein
MRRLPLLHHTSSPPPHALRIAVEAKRRRGRFLEARFEIRGDIGAIVLPPYGRGERREGLWKSTCLEAFVAPASGPAYVEFNLSPSGDWAAYRFDGERQGMAPLVASAPILTSSSSTNSARFDALFDIAALPFAPSRAGITLVIEHVGGARSYWALAHCRERPDFHDPRSFTLDIGTI